MLDDRMINSYAYKPFVYLRYIDDIFMIWTEGEENLNGFLSHCNQNQQADIEFEQVASKEKISFRDVSVIHKNRKLHTDLYSKLTDKHQYLYSHSCHPNIQRIACPIVYHYNFDAYVLKKPTNKSTPQRKYIYIYI